MEPKKRERIAAYREAYAAAMRGERKTLSRWEFGISAEDAARIYAEFKARRKEEAGEPFDTDGDPAKGHRC